MRFHFQILSLPNDCINCHSGMKYFGHFPQKRCGPLPCWQNELHPVKCKYRLEPDAWCEDDHGSALNHRYWGCSSQTERVVGCKSRVIPVPPTLFTSIHVPPTLFTSIHVPPSLFIHHHTPLLSVTSSSYKTIRYADGPGGDDQVTRPSLHEW